MRRVPIGLWLLAGTIAAAVPRDVAASDTATASLHVSVSVASRTSLRVSSEILHFNVTVPSDPSVASVEVTAGARTVPGGEVVLSIDRGPTTPGAHEGGALTFVGDGEGLTRGVLDGSAPAIAGRWTGSGRWSGRVSFALRRSRPGAYSVPVRFVLSTP